jgi:predicted metal-dependent hydrolase
MVDELDNTAAGAPSATEPGPRASEPGSQATRATSAAPTAQSSNPDNVVAARRISFDEALAGLPHHFAADHDPVASHVMATLSSMFPDGEDFFVRSVRHYRDRITDPALRRQVAGFIGQEATHGREHRALNARLAALGYPTARYERFTRWGLTTRERVAPAMSNLAATAALEHFTATLAEVILGDPAARSYVGDNVVGDLFVWHALEESEHKAVAFDVYKAVGGSERMRTFTMDLICVGFVVGTTLQVIGSLLLDRDTYRHPVRLLRSARRFLRSPFVRRSVWRRLRDYDRHDFHPDDHDNRALTAEWRERLFGADGSLNDRLTGSAA